MIRSGQKQRISSAEVVPGDIVLLQSGDKVPADMRLFQTRDLQVDESALTGESVPVDKKPDILDHDTGLADRRNMAYASSSGHLRPGGRHCRRHWRHNRSGANLSTDLINREIGDPAARKIARFSHMLLYAILALAAITFVVGLIRGQSVFDMFMAAVALAVGAIPEGLPAAMTITLAIGVARMARSRAIIRKLPAVETLGSTTIICSDKTGTLTENQMTVQEILAGGELFEVSGTGYTPQAGFSGKGLRWMHLSLQP